MVTLICAAVLVLTAAAQRKTPLNKGPRAVALVQWVGSGAPRVIPIAIMVDGRFYDASIYKASPVPMALEPGIVYEVEESGESVGVVTLTDAKETEDGAWFAEAQYQTKAQLAATRAPRRTQAAAPSEEESGPPKLRRGAAKDTTSASAPASAPPPPASSAPRGPDEPPVLRKPASEPKAPQPPAAEGGRATSAPPAPAAAPEDTARPVLRRGHASAEQAQSLPGGVSISAGGPKKPGVPASAAAPGKAGATAAGRVLAAISDAGGPEPHSYLFGWTPKEQIRLTNQVEALASAALAEYARAHPGATPGKLEDVQVRAFDVDYGNAPNLVLTAHAGEAPAAPARRPAAAGRARSETQATPAPGGMTYWVTLVAREDFNGDLRKLMVSVTDSKHLDAFPRMELIDAVDVDGDGRGELLFREISDVGRNYVIYRVTPDNLRELFNTAEQ